MTRTFNDIEAVTRLLEEKEKDLELTARIGQELLTHNNQLEAQVAALEAQLKEEQDTLVQTQHELARKAELLAVLSAEEDSGDPSTPTTNKTLLHDILQKKVSTLELQNHRLSERMAQLTTETCEAEEKEKSLIKDMAQQLGMASKERASISEELLKLKEEQKFQIGEITLKTEQIYLLETANLELAAENSNLAMQLNATKHTQELLCTEILELKEQYSQALGLLQEAQEQVRKLNKRQLPSTHMQSVNKNPPLGNEIESSLMSFHSLDSGFAIEKPSYRRVFETVRSASRSNSSANGSSEPSPANQMFGSQIVQSNTFLTSATGYSPRMSPASTHSVHSAQSVHSTHSAQSVHSAHASPFRPPLLSQGAVGTPTLRSLEVQNTPSLSQEMGMADTQLEGSLPADSIDWALDRSSASRQLLEMDIDSYDCRTPESIMSTGSLSGASGTTWRLPQKLQIIKPIEGSATLHHWSQLARPNLSSAISEQAPCVVAKGQSSSSEADLAQYSLDDFEEDDAQVVNPGKQFEPSGHTFTLTNSTVLHPEERTTVTSSCQELHMSVAVPGCSRPASPPIPGTPGQQARRDSTITFSTNLGLAKGLNERGTGAAGSSPSVSACATPCNSPERPSSPQQAATTRSRLSRILAQGSEKLNWLLTAKEPTSRDMSILSRSMSNMGLVNRIEEVGLNNILRPAENSNPLLRSVGPMSQLAGRRGRLACALTPSSSPSSGNKTKIEETKTTPRPPSKDQAITRGREVRRDLGSVQARATPGKDTSTNDETKHDN